MKRILVADDNEADVYLLREGLSATGLEYELEHVYDGDVAIQRLLAPGERGQPDLVILDLHLPKVSGRSVVQAIESKGLSVPIIVLTSLSSERDRQALKSLGVLLILDKPADLESCFALGRLIHEFLQNR